MTHVGACTHSTRSSHRRWGGEIAAPFSLSEQAGSTISIHIARAKSHLNSHCMQVIALRAPKRRQGNAASPGALQKAPPARRRACRRLQPRARRHR
jgi:hypothetical protein